MSKVIKHEFAELFCGPGGIGLGASLASIMTSDGKKHVLQSCWANDIDPDACQTYRQNHHKDNPECVVCANVKDVDMNKIPVFEGLTFGFPCNDFSVVGEQKGLDGHYGGLYAYGAKLLDLRQPLWFIAENVGGLKSANEGKAFEMILRDLKNCGSGYDVTAHLYKFEDYGVPQQRHRIIMVGIRSDAHKHFNVPAPTTQGNPVSVRMAFENPPIEIGAFNNEETKQTKLVVERLRYIPEGKNVWFLDEMRNMSDSELSSWLVRLPNLTPLEREMYENNIHLFRDYLASLTLNVEGARLSQIYRRLQADQPSYTMTGSGGGGTHVYHWSEPRALTNRERARIQSFPDTYSFFGSKESVRKQIGMAVPPQGIKILFEALLKTLNGIPYDSVPSKV